MIPGTEGVSDYMPQIMREKTYALSMSASACEEVETAVV